MFLTLILRSSSIDFHLIELSERGESLRQIQLRRCGATSRIYTNQHKKISKTIIVLACQRFAYEKEKLT